ncbi:acid protease, partial [Piedraia hortae CBS 480.64]
LATTSMADPIYVPPSGRWDGADGKWSSFQMSVGNPPQRFRVLPAPVDTVVSVPLAAVCQNNLFSQRKDCGDLRGVENYQGKSSPGFNATASIDNTNIVGGPYTFPPYQRYFGNQTAGGASFWNDSVSIGDAHTVPKQLVAGINAQEFLLGEMGLGRLETTLQQGMTPVLSLLSSLYDQKMIPRPGFAYTAGRSYVHPPMNGSLVLGGFDKSGLTSNYATVTISSPDTLPLRLYDLVAGPTLTSLQQRLISHEDGITAYIDSSVAQLWLPNKTCDAIAAAFNLTYYDSSNYYGVPDEGTESLSILQNATFTFTVGSVSDKTGNMVQIILPYSAFDYNLSFPIETSTVRYFPLRRALNDNQITLGRVFLQEAYIAVDWDAKQMVIGQA